MYIYINYLNKICTLYTIFKTYIGCLFFNKVILYVLKILYMGAYLFNKVILYMS